MLEKKDDLYCGVFDSSVMRPNKSKSQMRTVLQYEIELFHGEGGVSHVNGEEYRVRRGMLLCAKPGDKRYSDFPVRCSFIRVVPEIRSEECDRIIKSLPTVIYTDDQKKTDELIALFGKLGNAYVSSHGEDDDVATLRINSLFFEILCRIVKISRGASDDTGGLHVSRVVREAYEYINENFGSDCSLRTIASAVHISPNYLHTIFCEQVGMTPFEYVCEKRIEKAKRLIMAGERSMLEIALETGFCSQSHFNKVFKEKCGVTPAQYRRTFNYEY